MNTVTLNVQVYSINTSPLLDLNPKNLEQSFVMENLDKKALQEILEFVIRSGLPKKEEITRLISYGADVNYSYPAGETLLHLAWNAGRSYRKEHDLTIFDFLFEKGARLDEHQKEFYSKEFLEYYQQKVDLDKEQFTTNLLIRPGSNKI